jgi:rod shape-determining protein MreB
MLNNLLGAMAEDIAIDLGTANTLIFVPGRGVVLEEPSVIAIKGVNGQRSVIAVGTKAKQMIGRTPEGVEAIRPMRDGVISDFVAAEEMVRHFIQRAKRRLGFIRPRVIVCVPASSTPVERRAIYESTLAAGARRVIMIEEPVAAAIGAKLPIAEPAGSMVVDIGGGTTDIAVLASGGIVKALSVRCAGNSMDESIMRYVRRAHSLIIGEANAERMKIEAGTASRVNGKAVDVVIRGRDLKNGFPTEVVLRPADIAEALSTPVDTIADAIQRMLEQVPPELAADIADRGVCLTGGGALLHNLDVELSLRTGVEFFLAEAPLHSVINGCGIVLANHQSYESFLIRP